MSTLSGLINDAFFTSPADDAYAGLDETAESILASPDPDAVVFYLLFPTPERLAADAVSEFTRTRIREESLFRRIMPPMDVGDMVFAGTAGVWAGLGVPRDELIEIQFGDLVEYTWSHDRCNSLVAWVENLERNVAEEADYQARLAARTVTAREYRRHSIAEAARARYAALDELHVARFRTVISGLVSDILAHAGSGETT